MNGDTTVHINLYKFVYIDNVTYAYTALCRQNTVHVIFHRAKRCVVMVILHTLSSWLPKHKGCAQRYAHKKNALVQRFEIAPQAANRVVWGIKKRAKRMSLAIR